MANETFLQRWFEEVWNKGREEAIFEMFAEDGIAHGLTDENGNELCGAKHFAAFHKNFRAAIPDINITVEETVIEGEKLAGLCKVTGTHKGNEIGFAPTNKPIEIYGLCLVKLRDGKIAESWNQFDFMNLYRQLDVITFK
ncbi:MAG TPA: ester cyclase [Pyrinomonadaceae bacterium]|jgi:steroid delta-isomerase-like uncharacterized protein